VDVCTRSQPLQRPSPAFELSGKRLESLEYQTRVRGRRIISVLPYNSCGTATSSTTGRTSICSRRDPIPKPFKETISEMAHCLNKAVEAELRNIAGNNTCCDCDSKSPQWASVSFGVFMCLECSGRHRSLGVHVSFVRSVSMDSWSEKQVRGGLVDAGMKRLTRGDLRRLVV